MCGGWYFDGESCMYYYGTKQCHVFKGGLVLGNINNHNRTVPLYCLDLVVDEQNCDSIYNYTFQLFGSSSLNADALYKYFLASLIYWYGEFNAAYNTINVAAMRMLNVRKKITIKHDKLLDWSWVLKKD
eukprot:19639-Ditylum_brightwellii.AAC.2